MQAAEAALVASSLAQTQEFCSGARRVKVQHMQREHWREYRLLSLHQFQADGARCRGGC